jgi:hypothetical protein
MTNKKSSATATRNPVELFTSKGHRHQHEVPQSVVGGDEEATNCIRDQKAAKDLTTTEKLLLIVESYANR